MSRFPDDDNEWTEDDRSASEGRFCDGEGLAVGMLEGEGDRASEKIQSLSCRP